MAGKLEQKRNVIRSHGFFHVVCAAFVFLCVVIVANPAFSIKVKDNSKPAENPSGTSITIETLEQISSRSATSTVEIEAATATVVVDTATATVVVDTATATVVVAETPATQTSETQDESVEAIPEAQQSNRYKDKLKEVRGETTGAEPEPVETPEINIVPPAEVVAEEKPPFVASSADTKPVETSVVETSPVEVQPSVETPVIETVTEPVVPVKVVDQPVDNNAKEVKEVLPEEAAVKEQVSQKEEPVATQHPVVTEETSAADSKEAVAKEDAVKPPVAADANKTQDADVPPAPQAVAQPQPAEREPTIQIAVPPSLETDKKESVVEVPAPQKQPEKAKTPVVEKAVRGETGFYTVRSGPVTDEHEKEELVRRLTLENYHPSVKEVSVKEGRKYYILEMGAFKDATVAAGLLYQLRNIPGEFFIINPDGENVDASEGLVPMDRAGRLIPHRSGELGDNSLALISDYATREGRAPASMDAPIATGPRKMQKRLKTPQYIHDIGSGAEKPVRVEGLTLSNKLRDIAWELRESGYGVYLEQETFLEKEGVLVGVIEDKNEASKLGEELLGYGYAVNIIYEGDGNYYVYADIENPAREITIVDKELLLKHGVTDEFVPPPDPMADNLLRLIPRKIR